MTMNVLTIKQFNLRRGLSLVILGTLNTLLGMTAGFGCVMYYGTSWQATNVAALFLLLGVGIDDMFVMLSAWNRQLGKAETLAERMRETYKEAAVSITITSITNICSFGIGAIVPTFKVVSIFCTYVASGLLAIYLWTLTFYGACIAIVFKVFKEKLDNGAETSQEDVARVSSRLSLKHQEAQKCMCKNFMRAKSHDFFPFFLACFCFSFNDNRL